MAWDMVWDWCYGVYKRFGVDLKDGIVNNKIYKRSETLVVYNLLFDGIVIY